MASAAYMREWRTKNPTRAREISRDAGVRFRKKHPERWKEIWQASDAKRHGICVECGGHTSDKRAKRCFTCAGFVRRTHCSICGDKTYADQLCRHHYEMERRPRMVGLNAMHVPNQKEINLWKPAEVSFSDDFKNRVLAKYDIKIIDGGTY